MVYSKKHAQELGADCSNCPLQVGGKFVGSIGPEKAELAFVGEAPGRQEVDKGIPFIGPSGRLLQLVNTQYGIERENVFLSNATLCRPADGSAPPKAAVNACRQRLHNELHGRKVRTVVTLGNKAALSVLGVEGVTKLRVGPGKESPYPLLDGIRVIPTVHPAACLRQSDMFPSLVADIGKISGEQTVWNPPEYTVYDDEDSAVAFLQEVMRKSKAQEAFTGEKLDLVLDIEVDIEKDTAFDHPDRYGMLCVGFAYEEGKAHVVGEEALKSDRVLDVMSDCLDACRLIAQNGKFDLAGLVPHVGVHQLYFDTMLAHYVLDERPGIHGLKAMAIEYLGAPQYDEEIKQYVGPKDGYGNIPRNILYRYNAYDAACTYQLQKLFAKRLDASSNKRALEEWQELYPSLDFKSLRDVHDFLVETSNELMFLELNGIAVDLKYNGELSDKYEESIASLKEKINLVLDEAGYVQTNSAGKIIAHNPASPKQVQEVFSFYRIRAASTDEDTLKAIRDKIDEVRFETGRVTNKQDSLYRYVELLLIHRKEAKFYGTYVKVIIKRLYRGRVYPTFLLHGTTTGRLASRNPNAQNIPRDSIIKQQFVPSKPENVFVQADYSQAELRVLTWLAKDEYFREILNDATRDLFDELTPRLYPELPVKTEISSSEWKEIRIRVKAFVYGLGYGRTEFSIAQEYKLSITEAQLAKKRFFETIPSIVEWQQRVKKRVYSGKDLITPFGRHRRFHLITNDNWKSIQNEALAFLPQSTSSDICLRAMGRVRRELRGTGSFIRNIVHDSILVETPADMASDVAALLDNHMVQSARELVGDYVEFRTDVNIGKHWGEV